MDSAQVYPKHIYQPIRIRIATNYLKQEVRKILPSVRGDIWQKIDADIDNWFEKSPNLAGVRDFWNGFHGIAMGFKLKLGLIQVITAENIEWCFEKYLPLDKKLASGGDLKYIHSKLSEKRPRAARLREFFARHPKLTKKWKEEFTKHSKTSEARDQFPIIAMEEVDNGEEILSIHDGNRRMILAVLEGKRTISAYVGKYKTPDKTPRNFWLPSSFLMELVKEGELSGNYQSTLNLLSKLIKLSKSAEYELKERVLIGKNKFKMQLRKDFGFFPSE